MVTKCFFSIFFSFSLIFLSFFGISCLYGYMFPQKYAKEIALASETFDVKKEVIYSVINTESRFNKNAESSKGAQGLMQIMPTTAEELAEQLSYDEYDLKNAENNVMLGTFYISVLEERFKNLETALAAYNAGPTNVKNWLSKSEYSDDGVMLKKIPFEETRNYIEKFKVNFNYYSKKSLE